MKAILHNLQTKFEGNASTLRNWNGKQFRERFLGQGDPRVWDDTKVSQENIVVQQQIKARSN